MRVSGALPAVGDAFEWTCETWGPALHCVPLAAVAAHLFTTRTLRLERSEAGGPAWEALAAVLGAQSGGLRRLRQVHGAAVVCYRKGRPAPAGIPVADIVVSDDPSLVVAVQVADCVPLLVADRQTGAVSAAHVGWRGAVVGVPRTAVAALVREFRSEPADLVAAIGPSIGPCCYEVGEEVRNAFRRADVSSWPVDTWFVEGARGHPHLDLWQATRDQLTDAGMAPNHIHACNLCTATHRGLFYSYRADGAGTGRFAGAIRTK
jgi:YfiH family protein